MGYRKAEKILPPEVVALIQQYVDGEYIYIPRKEENRKCWGESTDYRREMDERNRRIYEDYLSGMKTDTLSMKYFLSEKVSRELLQKRKRDRHEQPEGKGFRKPQGGTGSFFCSAMTVQFLELSAWRIIFQKRIWERRSRFEMLQYKSRQIQGKKNS